jgi:hypothetical protein
MGSNVPPELQILVQRARAGEVKAFVELFGTALAAYDPVDRRGRTGLDRGDECTPLVVVELRGMPGRLAVDEAIRPSQIKPQDPIANGQQPHAPEQGRVRTRAAVINRHGRKQAPGDAPGLFRQNKGPKPPYQRIGLLDERATHVYQCRIQNCTVGG